MLHMHHKRVGTLVLAAVCALSMTSCRGGGRKKSVAAKWVDKPSAASKQGKVISFEELGLKFEIPDTLYVFKNCGESSHAPEGENKWIPILTCQTSGDHSGDVFGGGGGGGGGDEDEFSDFDSDMGGDEEEFATGNEALALTFYVTHKTRPIDERAVSWFENNYKQAGLEVADLSYQHDYQKKAGIFAKLQVLNPSSNLPSREIIQFMFPRHDVVFIARTEYPFGDTRSVMQDWKYILWNFDIDAFDVGGDEADKNDEEDR